MTRMATSAAGEQGVWPEEKTCSIRNVTSAVLGERVCKYWERECAVPGGSCL